MSAADSPWKPLRRWEWIGIGLWLGYIPSVVVLGYALARVLHSDIPYAGVALAWMGLCAFGVYRTGSFLCPRCGKRFFRQWWYQGAYARRCAHCGLAKFDEPGQREIS